MNIAALLDAGITLVLAGMNRIPVVEKVREMEAAGATADQITDALVAMRKDAEDRRRAAVDAIPE